MPTAKKRINLSIDDQLYSELQRLKEIKGAASLSAVVIDLTREALEVQEDLYFSKIAEERKGERTISHKNIWKL